MRYDLEASAEGEQPRSKRQQKRDRNRNKNNRRDNNNRPPKELNMEPTNSNISDKNNGAVESNKNPGFGGDKERGLDAMVNILDRGFQQINGSLQQFGGFTRELNDNMLVVVKDTTATREEVRKLNAWSKENILGDVRKAVVQIGVGGILAGAVALITYAFKKDEEEEVTGTTPATSATNGAARPRATT